MTGFCDDVTAVVRGSSDPRVFDAVGSVEDQCRVIAAITPDTAIEAGLRSRGTRYVVSPRGNPAQTSLRAFEHVSTPLVLLLDSDCIVYPGTVDRLVGRLTAEGLDAIAARVDFAHRTWSTRMTSVQREHQYYAFDRFYEPGLLLNVESVTAKVGYVFSSTFPFTPDGELDLRVRQTPSVSWTVDSVAGLEHAALSYRANLGSHVRYGRSDCTVAAHHGAAFWTDLATSLARKYTRRGTPLQVIERTAASCAADSAYLAALSYEVLRQRVPWRR